MKAKIEHTIVERELEKLERKHDKQLTPQLVVGTASATTHPLHDYFDWDDSVAGCKWRLEQARHLIQCVVYKPAGLETPIRKYVNVAIRDEETQARGNVYLPVESALTNADYRRQILARAMSEAKLFAFRYSQFIELAGVISEIKKLEENASPKS